MHFWWAKRAWFGILKRRRSLAQSTGRRSGLLYWLWSNCWQPSPLVTWLPSWRAVVQLAGHKPWCALLDLIGDPSFKDAERVSKQKKLYWMGSLHSVGNCLVSPIWKMVTIKPKWSTTIGLEALAYWLPSWCRKILCQSMLWWVKKSVKNGLKQDFLHRVCLPNHKAMTSTSPTKNTQPFKSVDLTNGETWQSWYWVDVVKVYKTGHVKTAFDHRCNCKKW